MADGAAQQALNHPWLTGQTATDHNLLPEISKYMAKARLRRGIEMVKLANRIEALKMQEDDPDDATIPAEPARAAQDQQQQQQQQPASANNDDARTKLTRAAKGAIFREVVLAKVREMKQQKQTLKVKEEAEQREAKRKSFTGDES